jgi:hypothetical protein
MHLGSMTSSPSANDAGSNPTLTSPATVRRFASKMDLKGRIIFQSEPGENSFSAMPAVASRDGDLCGNAHQFSAAVWAFGAATCESKNHQQSSHTDEEEPYQDLMQVTSKQTKRASMRLRIVGQGHCKETEHQQKQAKQPQLLEATLLASGPRDKLSLAQLGFRFVHESLSRRSARNCQSSKPIWQKEKTSERDNADIQPRKFAGPD